MAKKFAELRSKISPKSQARAIARAEAVLAEMQIGDLRKAHTFTQIILRRKADPT